MAVRHEQPERGSIGCDRALVHCIRSLGGHATDPAAPAGRNLAWRLPNRY